VIVWCIVPTGQESFAKEDVSCMVGRLQHVWQRLKTIGKERCRNDPPAQPESAFAGHLLFGQAGQGKSRGKCFSASEQYFTEFAIRIWS
jgi:hypothetical protein